MRWAIYANTHLEKARDAAVAAAKRLAKEGHEIHWEAETAQALKKAGGATLSELDAIAEVFLVIGGDGTILTAQQYTTKPMLTVNGGTLGFLSAVKVEEILPALERFLAEDYRIEQRNKMQVTLNEEVLPVVVNEVSLQSSLAGSLLKFHMKIDEQQLPTMRGDGVIVATSTGSTGYAMSAGGPILHPEEASFVLVPICPFHMASRPWVIPSKRKIIIQVEERFRRPEPAVLVIDGYHRRTVEAGDKIVITCAEEKAHYIRFEHDFYSRLSLIN